MEKTTGWHMEGLYKLIKNILELIYTQYVVMCNNFKVLVYTLIILKYSWIKM